MVSKGTAPDHLSTTLPRLEREDPSLSQQFIKPGSHKQFNQDEKAMIGRRKETDKRETVAQRHKQKQKSNKYSFLIKSITPSHQYNRFGMFTEKKKIEIWSVVVWRVRLSTDQHFS